jgi:hypothetical protein
MANARQAAVNTTRRRDELTDRLLAGPDTDAARALARVEGSPSGTACRCMPPQLRRLAAAECMSAHVADTRHGQR